MALLRVTGLMVVLLLTGTCHMTLSASDTNEVMRHDTQVLHARFVRSMLPLPSSAGAARVMQAAAIISHSAGPDGRFADVNYTTVGVEGRSWWATGTHLQRAIVLATAAHLPQGSAFAAAAEKVLRYWLVHDFSNSNWWCVCYVRGRGICWPAGGNCSPAPCCPHRSDIHTVLECARHWLN